jgi:CBS domain containing-hemolysin-like protein
MNISLAIVALSLVMLNGFFVAAEFGMVKLRHTRVEEIKRHGNLKGKILAEIHSHLDAYLSACQLGITLASLGLGWIGEPAFAQLLEPLFSVIGIFSSEIIKVVAFFIAFSFLSFLHIVFGELVPKSIAIRQSERISLWTAIPLYGFYWIMYPAIWLLNNCANFILKWARLDAVHKGENYLSTEEIKMILSASHLHGELSKDETDILSHTLEFADLKAVDVMRPIEEMVALNIRQPISQILQVVMQYQYSRYPVYFKSLDKILGVLHVKDLFTTLYQKQKIRSLRNLINPLAKVSRHFPVLELLRKFREGMPHFAIVYGETDKPIGFITLDNLLHILVGRIQDEFHHTQDDWVVNKDGSILINGNCSISTLERILNFSLSVNEEDNINTLNGYILSSIGRLPETGERIILNDFDVIIEKIQRKRIKRMIVYPKIK